MLIGRGGWKKSRLVEITAEEPPLIQKIAHSYLQSTVAHPVRSVNRHFMAV